MMTATQKKILTGTFGFVIGFTAAFVWLNGSWQQGGIVTFPGKTASENTSATNTSVTTGTKDGGPDVKITSDTPTITITNPNAATQNAPTSPIVSNPPLIVPNVINLVPSDNIKVADQAHGSVVIVSSVTLDEASWVAVRDNISGMPGRILGTALFVKGTSSGTIKLLRQTVAGTHYIVTLYADDGNTIFNARVDQPVADASGALLSTEFLAK